MAGEEKSPVPASLLREPADASGAGEGDDEDEEDQAPSNVQNDPKANRAWQAKNKAIKSLKEDVKAKDAEIARLTTEQTPDLNEVMELRNQLRDYEIGRASCRERV